MISNLIAVNQLDRMLSFYQAMSARPLIGDTFYQGADMPQMFFVDSVIGSDSNDGRDMRTPFATINEAFDHVSANRGDVVWVMPGHTETVVAANGLDFDVAGTFVIGLGNGAARPTINLTTATTASVRINANSIHLENLLFTGGIDALDNVLTINGKTDVVLRNVEYRDVTGQAVVFLLASNNSDRLLIDGLKVDAASAAGPAAALALDGCDEFTLRNFSIKGNFSVSAIDFRTTLSARVEISNGYIWQQNAADICIKDTITACTGRVGPGLYLMLTDNAANITEAITGATFHQFGDIKVCNLAGELAMEINTTASTDA